MVDLEFPVRAAWWRRDGRIVIPKEVREHFPAPGEPIIIVDEKGRSYRTMMHRNWKGARVNRIDGLHGFFRNYPTIKEGTRLRVSVFPGTPYIARVIEAPPPNVVVNTN